MSDYTKLKRLAEIWLVPAPSLHADAAASRTGYASSILALIAENERLTKRWGDRPAYRTPEYESRRDAMWRRAHMVATSKGYDHINMAIAAAPSACADCMGCGGEWQGEGIPNAVCETCNGSRGKALEAERDQLKAENELMRHRLAACAKEMRTASDWICKEVEVPTKSATHWAIRLKTNADQVDGALGKGEQS